MIGEALHTFSPPSDRRPSGDRPGGGRAGAARTQLAPRSRRTASDAAGGVAGVLAGRGSELLGLMRQPDGRRRVLTKDICSGWYRLELLST